MTQVFAAVSTNSSFPQQLPTARVSRRQTKTISPAIMRGLLRASDYLAVTGLGFLAASLYLESWEDIVNAYYVTTIGLTGLATIVIFQFLGLYASQKFTRVPEQISGIAIGWTMALAIVISTVFFTKLGIEFSRVWLALWYGLGLGVLAGGRIVLARKSRQWAQEGRLFRRAVIYGANDVAADVANRLKSDTGSDVRIVGIFDDRVDGRVPNAISGLPLLGGIEDLIQYCRDDLTDIVIVALPVAGETRFSDVVGRLSVLPADIKMPAHATRIRFSPRTYSHVGPVAMVDLFDKPITDWGRVSKWLFDTVIASAALVLLAPVMAWVAFMIKRESKGPVFFKQKRYGFNNELIEVYKFRSMYTDMCDAAAAKLVTKDDPRVTPFGRFIRKTSLDELPQLINVVKGDLSLVGPRPHAMSAKAAGQLYDDVVDGYFARHKVKPGITGWAQINGWRGETDTEEKIQKRVEHDLYYIENWSVFFDLYILLKTPLTLISNKNAY